MDIIDICYEREVREANGHPNPEWMRKYLCGEWSPEMIGQYKSLTSLLPYLSDGSYGEWYGGKAVMALLMSAVRTDRFCEGALLELLEVGSIQRWIARLAELDREAGNR